MKTKKHCLPCRCFYHFQGKWMRVKRKAGFGTLEIVIIIAVLLSVALLFRSALFDYAQKLITTVFHEENVIADLASDQTNR